MKIDSKKPLPDHTRLDYDECCALLILKELFPERYYDLKIADKPDLQCEKIGVEVTIASDRKHQEALNNWVKANYCEDKNKKQKYVDRMSQLGVKYTGGMQTWPGQVPSFKEVRTAVNLKVEKLRKGNYSKCEVYELFIFTDTWMHEDIVQEAKEYFDFNNIFDFYRKIYILEKNYLLFCFEKDNIERIEIDTIEQTDRNIRARQMVELAERE